MRILPDHPVRVLTVLTWIFATLYPLPILARDPVEDEFYAIAQYIASPPGSGWMQHAYSAESMPLAGERDPVDVLLRRARTLLEEFNTHGLLDSLGTSLINLELQNSVVPVTDTSARLELFRQVEALSRKIAFANPLLNFKDIVFLKRPYAKFNHMVDQYFGFHGIAGGGIYILENAFTDNSTVRDVLANSVVANGRFQGQPLNFGSFCNPSLSYDGQTIFFSHTETGGPNYTWTENTCYHIFSVNIDGSDLRQLTDGPVNDLFPYPLPSGRIVFVSDRRGGYGRCHARKCPGYTLHTMNADGTDITVLSVHETNEWHPSVDNDGMIIYTRWDYVDRGDDQAHHPWICYPDGRDARAIHGNWKAYRSDSPYMEQHVRAIPGSHRYVATASPHHGQTFGSFVLIDPRVEDDNKMSPLKVLTPDAQFPEATTGSGNHWKYASAWALNERFYLCGYDPYGAGGSGNHALTLLDAKTGLKTTIYHDDAIPCYQPVPLTPRPVPPLIPHRVASGLPLAPGEVFDPSVYDDLPTTASIALMNVYDSTLPFPDGTAITALRIYEVLPKTTWHHHDPHVGYAQEDPARRVLGTVPVESDGSAYFTVPADTPIFFQALDETGMAVQGMRSLTYAKPGDTLTCAGCHEPQGSAPLMNTPPRALLREPSDIAPEVEGSNPFSYPRLVQPVLDAKCVSCHQQQGAINLSAGAYSSNDNYWYTSYLNLLDYAFFYGASVYDGIAYDTWNPRAVSTPGEMGARASRLYQEILSQEHNGLQLTAEEMRRITLWLDSNSDFFGAYENTLAQSQGQIVQPLDPMIRDYQWVINTDYTVPAIPAKPTQEYSNNNGLSEFGSPLELSAPLTGGSAHRSETSGRQIELQRPVVEAGTDRIAYVNDIISLVGAATINGRQVEAEDVFTEWSLNSGPGDVMIEDSGAFSTPVQFPRPGSYLFQLKVVSDGLTGSDEVLVTVLAENSPPLVDAGPDQRVSGSRANLPLTGYVDDDDAAVTTSWTQISGPATVDFEDPSVPTGTVTLPATGTYVLRLRADDGQLESFDECTILVLEQSSNTPPAVFAGDDITACYSNNPLTLQGSASDDGNPASLTTTWSVISGPGPVTFGDSGSPTTSADFSSPGYYVLQLTAYDGARTAYDQLAVYLPPPDGVVPGSITWECWEGISGNAISNLTNSVNFPENPDYEATYSSFQGPTNWNDNYGSRMHGYLVPQISGDYTFWIASDDNSELWLSTDQDPANATLIASVPVWTNSREWDKYPSQQSAGISLEAGKVYYILALQKDGGGGDNLAVAWQGPGISRQVIDGQFLAAYEHALEPTGIIMREYWTGIGGTIRALTGSANYPHNPVSREELTAFEGPGSWGDHFGSRIHGYIYPPESGHYTFWIASDDDSELWLATDEHPDTAMKIASVTGWTASREWDKFASQQSTPIALEMGQAYYIMALHRDGGGLDNLAVAWQGPGIAQSVIDGRYLSEYRPRWRPPPSSGPIVVPPNHVPGVSAGSDLEFVLDDTAILHGLTVDDGLPLQPGTLTIQWQKVAGPGEVFFADASLPITSATFTAAGRYLLRLEANDGELSNSDSVIVTVSVPTEYDYFYPSPQEVAWSTDGTYLSVANTGLNRVAILDTASQSILHSVPVEGSPRGMAWVSADQFWVCEYDAGTLALVDAAVGRVVRRIESGPKPYDVKYDSTRDRLVVSEYGLAGVRIIDISTGGTVAEVPATAKPMYLALTPDVGSALVANSEPTGDARADDHAANVTAVDLDTFAASQIELPYGSTSLRGIAISPDGNWAYVAHLLGRTHLPTTQLNDGWIFNNVVSILDLNTHEFYATVSLDALEEGAANPWGLALSDNGNTLWICGSGVHELISLDLTAIHSYLASGPQVRAYMDYDLITLYEQGWIERYSLSGKGPRGIAISPAGDMLAVAVYFAGNVQFFMPHTQHVAARIATGPRVPEHALRRGERLYFDGDGCFQRWLSCSSCHPGARSDGMNWDLLNDGIGNPKNSMTHLYSTKTPPSMSTGVRASVAVAIQAGFKYIQFQQRRDQEMQDVYDYLESVRPERSPYLNKKWMTVEALHGKAIFNNPAVGCATCHRGPYLTNLEQYDVGTGHAADIGPYDPIYDTPGLHELWRSAPYLHDGSAPTLREVLTTDNPDDLHGKTSHLTDNEIDALVAYLQQIGGEDNWTNTEPVVEAGTDLEIISPTRAVQMVATARDEGLPASTLDGHWRLVSGPETVVFSDPTDPDTEVTFSTAGEYVFEFAADDGEYMVTDTMLVSVFIYAGDLTFDGKVNMADIARLSQRWQGVYDMLDLQTIANEWLLDSSQ